MGNGVERGANLRRFWFPAAGIATLVVMVVIFAAALHGAGNNLSGAAKASPTPALQGGPDMQSHPAPTFALHDQNGEVVSLQALRGHPLVLTFMDATCTEQCPIMIQYLNWAAQQFMTPQQVAQVEWVAISVNPNNTPAEVATLSGEAQTHHAHPLSARYSGSAPAALEGLLHCGTTTPE